MARSQWDDYVWLVVYGRRYEKKSRSRWFANRSKSRAFGYAQTLREEGFDVSIRHVPRNQL